MEYLMALTIEGMRLLRDIAARDNGIIFTTDKVSLGYMPVYYRIADELGPAANVCELGVMQGDSLDMWQVLFPAGIIAGVDSNPSSRWPPGTRQIICSQDDPQLPAILGGTWDLIVDDCSHEGEATSISFDNLWPMVTPGGYYVIENVNYVALDDPEPEAKWRVADLGMGIFASNLLKKFNRMTDIDVIEYRLSLVVVKKAL
jgi:hypothetical protein